MIITRNQNNFTTSETFIGYQFVRDQDSGIYNQLPLYRRYLVDANKPEPVSNPYPTDFARKAVVVMPQTVIEEAPDEEVKEDPIMVQPVEEVEPPNIVIDFQVPLEAPEEQSEPEQKEEVEVKPEIPAVKKIVRRKKTLKKKPAKKGKVNGKEYTGKPRGRKKGNETESQENIKA